jgi:hypothetical protein
MLQDRGIGIGILFEEINVNEWKFILNITAIMFFMVLVQKLQNYSWEEMDSLSEASNP